MPSGTSPRRGPAACRSRSGVQSLRSPLDLVSDSPQAPAGASGPSARARSTAQVPRLSTTSSGGSPRTPRAGMTRRRTCRVAEVPIPMAHIGVRAAGKGSGRELLGTPPKFRRAAGSTPGAGYSRRTCSRSLPRRFPGVKPSLAARVRTPSIMKAPAKGPRPRRAGSERRAGDDRPAGSRIVDRLGAGHPFDHPGAKASGCLDKLAVRSRTT